MTAHEDLRDALAAVLDTGDRPPCCWPQRGTWWLAEDVETRAKAVEECQPCPILAECGAASVASRERFGVWGGRDVTPAKHRGKATT